jgi:hypothetical protein
MSVSNHEAQPIFLGKLEVLRAQSELETILRLCFEKAA